MRPPAILETIRERVLRDPKGPGFAGRIAIGVKAPAGAATWLVLVCESECRVEWAQTYPQHDAAIGLDELAAAALLAGNQPPPGSLYITTGDGDLLNRFLARYFSNSQGLSPLQLRIQLAAP